LGAFAPNLKCTGAKGALKAQPKTKQKTK